MTNNFRYQVAIVIVAIVLTFVKFTAFYITHSQAIFTDALESIINVIASWLGLYSIYIASRPQDTDHPYGHGKIEFISASIEGSMIFIAGLIISIDAINYLLHPAPVHKIDTGLILIIFAGLVNFILGYATQKHGEKVQSMTLIASGEHLKSDAYSTAGIVVGLLIYYFTSLWWIDSTIAFIFGGIITFSGFKILRHSIAGIMDEADFDLVERIVQELNKYRNENWIDLHHFRIVKYGGFLHIDCHLTLPWFLNVREQEKELKKFTQIINGIYENDIEFSIQVEPCEKISCSICQKDDCPVRQNEFIKKMDWNLKTVLEDKKHAETPI